MRRQTERIGVVSLEERRLWKDPAAAIQFLSRPTRELERKSCKRM